MSIIMEGGALDTRRLAYKVAALAKVWAAKLACLLDHTVDQENPYENTNVYNPQ